MPLTFFLWTPYLRPQYALGVHLKEHDLKENEQRGYSDMINFVSIGEEKKRKLPGFDYKLHYFTQVRSFHEISSFLLSFCQHSS